MGMLKTQRQCLVTMGACVAVWLVMGITIALTPPAVSNPISPFGGVVNLLAFVLLVAAAVQWFRLRRPSAQR